MKAEIITIGTEILLGQTVDTNSAWLGKALSEVGVEVQRVISISDSADAIIKTLDGSFYDYGKPNYKNHSILMRRTQNLND